MINLSINQFQAGAALRDRRGFSLIELIGVMAIMAFLALMLTQTVIKRTDYTAVTTEQANLTTLTNALRMQLLRNGNIPSQAAWVGAVGNWISYPSNNIVNNARYNARAYLLDTSGSLSASGFTQSPTGTGIPVNARVMFVSSVGQSLPSVLLGSTPLGSTDFNNLWNSAAGSIPATGVWSGWAGRAEDVLIQRVNLQPMFYQFVLVNRDATASARYVVNGTTSLAVLNGASVNTFYLGGTAITLMAGAVAQTKYLVGQNAGYTFENGTWGAQIAYGTNSPVNTNVLGGSYSAAAKLFAQAGLNKGATNAGFGAEQEVVLASFANLMETYTVWGNDGFPDYGVGGAQNHLPVWILLQNAQGYVSSYAGSSGLLSK